LAFPAALLREFDTLESDPALSVIQDAAVLSVDEELHAAMLRTLPPTHTKSMTRQLLRHRVMEVLLLLAQRGYRFASTQDVTWPDKIRRLVAQRPQADWDAPAVATAFHMSESTLRRRLADSATTLAALVREVRLETALGLLQTTRLSIGEVAHHCGWQSHGRFSSAFRARWGIPPSQIRAKSGAD
jgi:AraC-like DNA-binding protein